MPCICHGAISGNEEFDRMKKEFPRTWNEVLKNLRDAAILINTFPLQVECDESNFHIVWMEAFAHMLQGCPENKGAKNE